MSISFFPGVIFFYFCSSSRKHWILKLYLSTRIFMGIDINNDPWENTFPLIWDRSRTVFSVLNPWLLKTPTVSKCREGWRLKTFPVILNSRATYCSDSKIFITLNILYCCSLYVYTKSSRHLGVVPTDIGFILCSQSWCGRNFLSSIFCIICFETLAKK